ncbi:MAG: AbiJ-NTD4 domain-containing protein [Salinarimonas sp.]
MTFSKRHSFASAPPITFRTDAPDGLRFAVIQNAYDCGPNYSQIRSVVCRVLLTAPDPNNWSEIPSIRDEVLAEIRQCDWYKVYDVAEALLSFIEDTYGYQDAERYAKKMNTFFVDAGIGWQFAPNEGIVFRGDETFQVATAEAAKTLQGSGRKNAASEIEEAIRDISRRPDPDITGAISHSMAAVECVAQDILGSKDTLGKIVGNLNLPKPLDEAVSKLYGFASQHGRHVSEQSRPAPEDAELLVQVSCAVCTYLSKRKS